MVSSCRHCGHMRRLYPRGLCRRCYLNLEVRATIPIAERVLHGVGVRQGHRHLPTNPTTALPGTPEKVAVLIDRASREELLWHPQDASGRDAESPNDDESCIGFLVSFTCKRERAVTR